MLTAAPAAASPPIVAEPYKAPAFDALSDILKEALDQLGAIQETDDSLIAESNEIDQMYSSTIESAPSGRPVTALGSNPTRKPKKYFNPNPTYVPATRMGKESKGNKDQIEFMERIIAAVKAEPIRKLQMLWTTKDVAVSKKPPSKALKTLHYTKLLPVMKTYTAKPVFLYAPFIQFDCSTYTCHGCKKANTMTCNGMGSGFLRAFGMTGREFVIGQEMICGTKEGCSASIMPWIPACFERLPKDAQKDLHNLIVANHSILGKSQLYRMIRNIYFFRFLENIQQYLLDLKSYNDAQKSQASVLNHFKGADSQQSASLLNEDTQTLFDFCVNPFLHSNITQRICDRLQANVVGDFLAFDDNKKIVKYMQSDGVRVAAAFGMGVTENKEIPLFGFRRGESAEDLEQLCTPYVMRLKDTGRVVQRLGVDVCCPWASEFRRIFQNDKLEVFLDRLHFLMRYTALTKQDHPLRQKFQNDLANAVSFKVGVVIETTIF
ncbi:hypothetical protein HDU79_009538 [Rhizoclosmatium sp. JEL0117]|nr:hypothetical protein HDU79_009538 [Rhizoclosmatium sp. JEL0117]